jgi:hypothetical protein
MSNNIKSITFSSCFYILKAKFDFNTYISWMNNFLSIVNNFNLVIYTDEKSYKYINTNNNPNIKIIIKPLENFYNYKYKKNWITNHNKNEMLKDAVDWKVNMLWSEKISFVKETLNKKYFETDMYGWCDIGYFRNRDNDLNTSFLSNWANNDKINSLDKNKIHYACVNNDSNFMNFLYKIISNKNAFGLPIQEIPPYQTSIAGGFFIIHKDKIDWWFKTYDDKLKLYFKNNYVVKDDQIILVDCFFSDINKFVLFKENDTKFDNWFMFQRILN